MLISKSKSTNYGFSANAIRNLNHSEKCKYYVYGLIDPDQDNPIPGFEEPFYIGKGCGNRVFDHIRQARKLLSKRAQIMQDLQTIPIEQLKGDSKKAESDKIQKIWEIFDKDKDPKCVIYRWGMTEQEAFEVDNWYTSTEEAPRIEFDGKPTTNPTMCNLVGKLIPEKYRQKGMANPFLYCNGK